MIHSEFTQLSLMIQEALDPHGTPLQVPAPSSDAQQSIDTCLQEHLENICKLKDAFTDHHNIQVENLNKIVQKILDRTKNLQKSLKWRDDLI